MEGAVTVRWPVASMYDSQGNKGAVSDRGSQAIHGQVHACDSTATHVHCVAQAQAFESQLTGKDCSTRVQSTILRPCANMEEQVVWSLSC